MFSRSKVAQGLKRLVKNQKGNMSIMFAFSALPIIIAAGAATDIQRLSNTKTTLQAALDSATLFAASLQSADNNVLTTKAAPYFGLKYTKWDDVAIQSFTIVDNGDHITGTAVAKQRNWFLGLTGRPEDSITAVSEVKKLGVNLEVSLVLDNTGSMNSGDGTTSNSPIADLRVAATNFVDTVMPASQTNSTFFTKVAIVPYNNSVNTGGAVLAATARGPVANGTSATPGYSNYTFKTNVSWNGKTGDYYDFNRRSTNCPDGNTSDGYCLNTQQITECVTERIGLEAYTDAPVSTAPLGRAYKNGNNPCSASPVIPLSTNKANIKAAISNLTAGNSTAGQVGIAWGWYALSPRIGLWSGASQPASYAALTATNPVERVRKIMVLMTDGEYNSAMCNGVTTGDDPDAYQSPHVNGTRYNSGEQIDHIKCAPTNGNSYAQANNMCQAIKQSGVEVFVIGFQLKTQYADRVALLNNCATDASHVLNAASQADLDKVFKSLANTLLAMRIAK